MLTFNKESHRYELDGKELISVTQLIKKHKLDGGQMYEYVKEDILKSKAERGTLIHEEIDNYIKKREIGFTKELQNFIKICREKNIKVIDSEKLVNNDIVAGTIDLISEIDSTLSIIDHKTVATLNTEYISWQLSLYSYLYNKEQYEETKLYVLWYKDDDCKLKEIHKKPISEVEELLRAERNGDIYSQSLVLINKEEKLALLNKLEITIKEFKEKQELIEKEQKELKEELLNAMLSQGIKKLETDSIVLTLKDEYIRESVDLKKLKEEHKEIYEKCKKESVVKASLLIKIK